MAARKTPSLTAKMIAASMRNRRLDTTLTEATWRLFGIEKNVGKQARVRAELELLAYLHGQTG